MDPLRRQYERFPYPPVPWFALPTASRAGSGIAGEGTRILVAGCGTLEALAVAQNFPRAAEVVALDFSRPSLARLRHRALLARIAGRRFAPLRLIEGDLLAHQEGPYDLIFASNVLHHLADPAAGLLALADRLAPGGRMRIVTYPRHSRLWMRSTGAWLRARGLDAGSRGLVRAARRAIRELPAGHPFRSCFESQPETGRAPGLIDAFFNARENPLSPLQWRAAARLAGLELTAEEQAETSRSDFLSDILPATQMLDPWEKLQALDDLLELCANPALWLEKRGDRVSVDPAAPREPCLSTDGTLAQALDEAGSGLRRALALLDRAGVDATSLHSALKLEVGPRVTSSGDALPGLSLLDYDWEPWLKEYRARSHPEA